MRPTRRLFLQEAAFSVIAASLPLSVFAQKSFKNPGQEWDPESLSLFEGVSSETFKPWIGSRFRASLNGQARGSLVLLSVDENGVETTNEESEGANVVRRVGPVPRFSNESAISTFSLRFQKSGSALPQDTYMLAHDWLGNFPLFLVPSGLPGASSTYTAVFTLLPHAGSMDLPRVVPQNDRK